MKIIKLLFVTLAFGGVMRAEGLLEKLVDINDRWAYEQHSWKDVPNLNANFSESELIQQHLYLVHAELSQRSVENLTLEQKQNRASSLVDLYKYAKRGLFPNNITHKGRRPIFIDGFGVHCAVGFLIKESGHPELSKHISANMNDAYLLDMRDSELNNWVSQSGFTAEELAWIQPGYFQPIDYEPLKGGVNGPVNTIISDNNSGIYAGGKFDTADGQAAGSFANYFSGFAGYDWMGIGGSGFQGHVSDAIMYHGELYVAGYFYMVDTTYVNSGVAKWDGSKWTAVGDFYTGALVNYVLDLEIYEDTLYAGGFFKSRYNATDTFQSLAKWDGTEWRATALDIYGEVGALHVYNNKLIVGGVFQLNDTAGVENIAMLNGRQAEYFDASVKVPVYDIEDFGNEIFIGTDFYTQARQDSGGLVVYRNNTWETVFGPGLGNYDKNGGVKCLEAHPDALLIGGDFDIAAIVGNYGKNMGLYRNGYVEAFGMLDSTVRAMTIINDQLYLGGDFNGATTSTGGVTLNHIAQVDLQKYLSTETAELESLKVFPNPAIIELNIELPYGELNDVKLIDMSGRVHSAVAKKEGAYWKLNVEHLQKGNYVLSAKTQDGVLQQKVIIE
ncbi:hypothetical protein Oweho_2152 [Owenweeksia hongkongensis DSM 17368]|uniref:Secretion system C-terminal sorting domain-containing protein n=1 Tax=Owenweeksia hongkongensis (strain DSM 17368 / CIP 108786 / JCM 12287 / NRRL B-23963 / UST20020801) TaxID=926562 RepID=G8R459_OWEHD|nr:T9SS type A sorting domain-containing protein [Owenweeksia hongkongensis]AEV33126.1 hypothetical protein Oweho_2152 [Owenweeksia hongkongensis DSM 17368]